MNNDRPTSMVTPELEHNVPLGQMKEVLRQKAHDLFVLCDKEDKGFATKRDMYRLEDQLPLTPEQLDEVFDELDKDGNGCLTLREFTEGLGKFLGVECQLFHEDLEENDAVTRNAPNETQDDEDDEKFEDFLDSLGAQHVFSDEEYIKHMWEQVRKDDPAMFQNFQNLLRKITQELKNTKKEYCTLENTLKTRATDHEEQVQALYSEMEEQLEAEKEKLIAQERLKEQQIKGELESELQQKNRELQELLSVHEEMKRQLEQLNACELEKKHENVKLQKERDKLQKQLASSEKMLNNMKTQLELLRKKSLEESRSRAKAALRVSEGIALEREYLAKQLCELKKMNLQLLDEKDELVHSVSSTPLNASSCGSSSSTDDEYRSLESPEEKKATSLRKHPGAVGGQRAGSGDETPFAEISGLLEGPAVISPSLIRRPTEESSLPKGSAKISELTTADDLHLVRPPRTMDEECEVDDEFYKSDLHFLGVPPKELVILQNNLNLSPRIKSKRCKSSGREDKLQEDVKSKGEKATTRAFASRLRRRHLPRSLRRTESKERRQSLNEPQPLNNSNGNKENTPLLTPERIFKIVFVGDSGVGKSSFIHRYCNDSFRPTFSATVGLDFQVKTVNVDGRISALKLWDTAGQERFRSMTVQYFRHADGIVVIYDVTSETSFKNIRNWIFQVKEGVCENVVIMLIGNKTDLCKKDEDRVIRRKDGIKLAEEFGALFYETSAKTGQNVREAMDSLSRLLQKKEDEVLQNVVRLQETEEKKKKCC